MTTVPVGIGIGTAEPIPDGRPLVVAVGFVGGEDEGTRVELGAGIEVAGEGSDEIGGDTGPKPGMLIGKHFANSGWETDYSPCISNQDFLKWGGGNSGIDLQRV